MRCYTARMSIDESMLLEAYRTTGRHLQKKLDEIKNRPCGWVKVRPSMPSFADLVFSVGNRIYAVLIVKLENASSRNGKGITVNFQVMPHELNLLLEECKHYRLEPAFFPLWVNSATPRVNVGWDVEEIIKQNRQVGTMMPMVHNGWNLIDPQSQKMLNPAEMKDIPGEVFMSEWEQQNMRVNYVVEHIEKRGLQMLSAQDIPGMMPNIWFRNEKGVPSWVAVLPDRSSKPDIDLQELRQMVKQSHAARGDKDRQPPQTLWSRLPASEEPYGEYVAYVKLKSAEHPERPILRGERISLDFDKLESLSSL